MTNQKWKMFLSLLLNQGYLCQPPQVAFLALLGLTAWSLAWLHITVVRQRAARPALDSEDPLRAVC